MAELPQQAQAVIVGGGVGGCSIAYHLTKMGCTDVVVLERKELTSGSTWHSAGLVGQLRSNVSLTRMMQYSTDLYRNLKNETEQDTGWREVGGVRLASSPERMQSLKRLVGLARAFGMPLELISPKEAQDLFPLISLEGVLGAAYTPTDGIVDPSMLTRSLAKGARNRGARIFEDTLVTGIKLKEGRVDQVITDKGNIKTEVVVNAAGMWAGELARLVDVHLPVVAMPHVYLITKPIESVEPSFPTLRDPDLLVYFREEVGGLTVGGYERNPVTWALDGIPENFKYHLLPFDWNRMGPLMENAIKRVPVVETAEIRQLYNGPEAFTPDGEFLLGPTEVEGFWVAAAFCAHGLAGAGGIGKVMAEWILEGNPEWDVWPLDLRRFGHHYSSQSMVVERTLETYSEYYDIHFPGEERKSGRPLRLSPAYASQKRLQASFGEKTGWERTNWYDSNAAQASHGHTVKGWRGKFWSPAIGVEHLATRDTAGLFDESSFSKIVVSGSGALDFLQSMCSNNLDAPVGKVVYTSMLNPHGGIECDFTVSRIESDQFLIITGTALMRHDLIWIMHHMPKDGSVTVEDVTSKYACIGLWGPNARTILERVTREDVSHAGFPYMSVRKIHVGWVPALAMRVTYVGELGWEIYCPMESGKYLWDTLYEEGQPHGLIPAGYRAIDSLRLEKGYRSWGTDITPETTPFEAGLAFAVDLNKGDFIGRDALLAQKESGIKRKLCCLALGDPCVEVMGNEPLRLPGEERVVGWITSGGYGYSVKKALAYAYLPLEYSEQDMILKLEFFGDLYDAIVVRDPQVDPKNKRIKS